MCLILDRKKNCGFIFKKPHIANKDILVYKAVYEDVSNNMLCAPYQRGYYYGSLNQNAWNIKSILAKPRFFCEGIRLQQYITYGLHAYYIRECIKGPIWANAYYAVIPKGSKYYIGNKGDIVSDKLIIYKELTSLILDYPFAKTLII